MKPEISSGKRLSAIWIVPIVAMLLGVWMVIYTMLNEGPEITIEFESAEDLTAGKTKVKLLNVDVGQVTAITLKPESTGVILTVKLDKEHEHLLREDTRFWVERARVGAGGISGLGTILSGAYIKLGPGSEKSKKLKKYYIGLENPPLTPADAAGIRLKLVSDKTSSVDTGDAVLYNGYTVGRIESMAFDEKEGKIHYDLFIDAPFHTLVNSSVRFWNTSGFKLDLSAEGFNVETGSLDTIIAGGVAFGSIPGFPAGTEVKEERTFKLYDSYQKAQEKLYHHGLYFVVSFPQSVGGLLPGAPVEYRGIKLGHVERIMIKELVASGSSGKGTSIPVLIYLEPDRIDLGDTAEAVERLRETIRLSVKNGMRATLQSGNLITGSLYINIDYYPDQELMEIGQFAGYETIPTLSGGLERIQQSISQVLDKINALPLEDTLANANKAIVTVDDTLSSLNTILASEDTQKVAASLNATMTSLQATLDGLSPDSPVYEELDNALSELNETLNSVEELARTLAASAVLLPTPEEKDPLPEAKH